MAVLQTKTVASCKICSSDHRAEIEALLELRSLRKLDADGKRVNAEYIYAAMREWGIENPNLENLKTHWRKHCEIVSNEEAEQVEQALSELNAGMLELIDGADGTVDGDLLTIFKLGMKRIRGRVLRGEDPGVSVDQAMKAAAELTKRSHNEAQRGLLEALGGGIMVALSQPHSPRQIEGAEVVEGEAVEEAEVAA